MPEITRLKFWKYYFPPLFWALLLFVASSIPDIKTPDLNVKFQDKWTHLLAYSILGILVARALCYQSRWKFGRQHYVLMAFILGTLYGISDEFHQAFVPGRFSDIYDIIADSIGALIGALIYHYTRVGVFARNPAKPFRRAK